MFRSCRSWLDTRALQGRVDTIRCRRSLRDAHARRILDGREDGRRRRNERRLANALGTEGTKGGGIFDQDRLHLRHVTKCRNEIVMQVLGTAWNILFHKGQAQTLRNAAMDLALDRGWIDRPADIMG